MFVEKSVKYSLILIIILIVIYTISLPVVAESPLVAVMPFEEGDLSWKGFRGDEILNGITQQVTDKLVKKEGLRVMERARIDEIMKEQNLGSSGRIDPATAAEIGKIMGVETMILGTTTRMEVKETGEVSIGPLKASQVKAVVTLRGRIVDTTTVEILNSFKSTGEENKESISISLSKLKGLSFGYKDI